MYTINISKNGHHYFATAERSISTETKLREVYDQLKKIYTEEEGYKLDVSIVSTISNNVDMDTIQPKQQYGVIVT